MFPHVPHPPVCTCDLVACVAEGVVVVQGCCSDSVQRNIAFCVVVVVVVVVGGSLSGA